MKLLLVAFALVMALVAVSGRVARSPGGEGSAGWGRPIATSRYVVRPGDTLWAIAGRLDPDGDPRMVVQALIEANGLGSPGLRPGQTLLLPRG